MNKVDSIKMALDVLGLPVLVSIKDIKSRYRYLSKKYHPDISKEAEQFKKISDSYRVLIDYVENYKFSFSDEEILKQLPSEAHVRQFSN